MENLTCKNALVVNYLICSTTLIPLVINFEICDLCPLLLDAHNALDFTLHFVSNTSSEAVQKME